MMRFIKTKLRTIFIDCVTKKSITCRFLKLTFLLVQCKTLGLHLGKLDSVVYYCQASPLVYVVIPLSTSGGFVNTINVLYI